jgi:hypothetical protein
VGDVERRAAEELGVPGKELVVFHAWSLGGILG